MRIKVSDLREIQKLILQEKISYSRGVEMLNEIVEEGRKAVICTDCGGVTPTQLSNTSTIQTVLINKKR